MRQRYGYVLDNWCGGGIASLTSNSSISSASSPPPPSSLTASPSVGIALLAPINPTTRKAATASRSSRECLCLFLISDDPTLTHCTPKSPMYVVISAIKRGPFLKEEDQIKDVAVVVSNRDRVRLEDKHTDNADDGRTNATADASVIRGE